MNRWALVCTIIFEISVWGQFRNPVDRTVALDVVRTFTRACALRGTSDMEAVEKIKANYPIAKELATPDVVKCFENYYSQLTGTAFLYRKVCQEVTTLNTDKLGDSQIGRYVLLISQYEAGIRPLHSSFNDCLATLPNLRGKKYLVDLAGSTLDIRALADEISDIKVKDPFAVLLEPFR